MESDPRTRVRTEVTIENWEDLCVAERGLCAPEQVRRATVKEALVDPGATLVAVPRSLIRQLGLSKRPAKWLTDTIGLHEPALYGPVRLTIQGRGCTMDVMAGADDLPVIIGRLPLHHMDLVIDSRNRCLLGNPAHGGEQVYELY